MKDTYKSCLKHLPKEVRHYFKLIYGLARITFRPAKYFLDDDPEAHGITKQETIDWMYAKVAAVFVNAVDKKKPLKRVSDPVKLEQLYEEASNAIEEFNRRYRSKDAKIWSMNFIADFHEIARRPLSTMDPDVLCYLIDEVPTATAEEVDDAFEGHWSWKIIKELDPGLFEKTKAATARASHFRSQTPRIQVISYDVLGDILLAQKLAGKCCGLENRIEQAIIRKDLTNLLGLHAELDKAISDFDEIFADYPEVIRSGDRHFSVLMFAEHFSSSASQNIALMGPGNLCAPCPDLTILKEVKSIQK